MRRDSFFVRSVFPGLNICYKNSLFCHFKDFLADFCCYFSSNPNPWSPKIVLCLETEKNRCYSVVSAVQQILETSQEGEMILF